MKDRNYQIRLQSEKRNYSDCIKVEDLPDIFHYWSDGHIRPRLERFGFSSPNGMFKKCLERQVELGDGNALRFLSIGSGNCEVEIELAVHLRAKGHSGFVIDCLDLNTAMLDRARVTAAQSAVEDRINLVEGDFNAWQASHEYDAVIANQALHHVLKLEHLVTEIKSALKPGGHLIVSEMIGRNGHQLWPEALDPLHELWRKLPPSYRFNHQPRRYEKSYVNTDYSRDSFEAIRSQDILPLLLECFHFELFIGFGNIINPFVERSFGPNFNATAVWDRNFIDEVHARDEEEISSGRIKPTHMLAVLGKDPAIATAFSPPLSPQFCVRWPGASFARSDAGKTAWTIPPRHVYEWGAWPHSSQSELEIACRRLSEATDQIRNGEDQLIELQAEVEKRTTWALHCEKEYDERTAWALQRDEENRALTAQVSQLEDDFSERTVWALKLAKELDERTVQAVQLSKDLEERTAWALQLSKELDERTAWALQLNNELERTAHARAVWDRVHKVVNLPFRMCRRSSKWIFSHLMR